MSGAMLGRELDVSRTTGNKLKSLLAPEFSINGNATRPGGAS
jgi:hypothetical protein